MIRLQDIKKIYAMGDNQVFALNGVDIHIEPKEFVAIIGPSGSGKSTLMNIIGCLDTADEGQYMLDNIDITSYSARQLATIRNRKIGFIFQQFNLLQKLTAYANVELPLVYQGIGAGERKRRVYAALDRVSLADRMHHHPNQLSGGQQQRVAIARALVTQPSLILADEPTGNLDSRSGHDIMSLLHELHDQGNTVVLITHDQHLANEARRQISISDGIVASDSSKEAMA